ncbi:MAG: hypothetical protein N2204_03455 [Anaerolineae bacterium]|nr:hypothetical protein [Anaerolineae bacterium]
MKPATKNLWVAAAVILLLALVVGVAAASTGNSRVSAPVEQTTAPAVASTTTRVETCTICHKRDGATHQTYYDQLYQDGVIKVTDVKYTFKANPDTTVVTFNLTMNGQPYDPAKLDNLSIYWVPYAKGKFQFEPARDRLSLKGKITWDGKGLVTSTLVEKAKDDPSFIDYTDVSKVDGLLVIYGRDETVSMIPGTRVAQAKYPFAAILETGAGVDYVSTANNAGCVKCHTDPYLKHGYIYAQVNGDPATDFYTCKACHVDNGEGGHYEWQLLVDNPELAVKFLAEPDEEKAVELLSEEQKALYAYTTSIMNDVHMSHAMEFPYPQSMANCVTCHEGKLDKILADENFTLATCKSCHPVTGAKAKAKEGQEPAWDTTKLALKTIIGEKHPPLDLTANPDCTVCHKTGGVAPAFSAIHTGYDKTIYTTTGVKYSDVISVTIQSATLNGTKLNVKFSATAKPDFKEIDVTKNMTPTVLVGLYGWNTKDFIIGAHERLIDDNKDGVLDSKDGRNLEAEVGSQHPRMKTISAKDGVWEVEADLPPWADLIKNGTVKRVEVGVLPKTVNADGLEVAVDAVTRTFDLKAGKFDDKAFSAIAETEKCESCHAALATNFHEPSYGGSVTTCRMCHITKAGASHLEMQSRSLDSYVHAIHSGQVFDVGDIDFTDPVQALHYEHHIGFPYPTHANTNCESCHAKGTYNAPSQSRSLPGLLSASDKNETWNRNIGDIPAMVSGPAERACGGCHRAAVINEDKAGELAMLNQHFEQGGYLIPAGDKPLDTLMGVINKVMALFK